MTTSPLSHHNHLWLERLLQDVQQLGSVQKVIDHRRISFPSDRLTIGQVRATDPEVETAFGLELEDTAFDRMLVLERDLATATGAKLLGLTAGRKVSGPESEPAMQEELTELYVRFGLASGKHQADELVRDIRRQVQGQMRKRT